VRPQFDIPHLETGSAALQGEYLVGVSGEHNPNKYWHREER
jgi:hypothetical protein